MNTVFQFEFRSLLRKKSFIITTIILMLIAFLTGLIPQILLKFSSSMNFLDPDYGIYIQDDTIKREDLELFFNEHPPVFYKTRAQMEKAIEEKEIEIGYVVQSPTSFEEIVKNRGLNAMLSPMEEILQELNFKQALTKEGLDYNRIINLRNMDIEKETIILGTDGMKNFGFLYGTLMGIYFMVILYGMLVATSVAREKSSRTMELLITYAPTNHLIFGKVFAVFVASFIQIALILGTAIISFSIFGQISTGATMISGLFLFAIDVNVLLVNFLFALTGYFFSLLLFAALGSLVSRVEDINNAVSPMMIFLVLGFLISMISLQAPDNIVLKIASYIPLTSFYAMPTRFTMGTATLSQTIISYGILLLSTWLALRLSAKIYRLVTVYYGNKIKWLSILKEL